VFAFLPHGQVGRASRASKIMACRLPNQPSTARENKRIYKLFFAVNRDLSDVLAQMLKRFVASPGRPDRCRREPRWFGGQTSNLWTPNKRNRSIRSHRRHFCPWHLSPTRLPPTQPRYSYVPAALRTAWRKRKTAFLFRCVYLYFYLYLYSPLPTKAGFPSEGSDCEESVRSER